MRVALAEKSLSPTKLKDKLWRLARVYKLYIPVLYFWKDGRTCWFNIFKINNALKTQRTEKDHKSFF